MSILPRVPDTNRMLFQVAVDASLEDENPVAGQTPRKGSSLVLGH